VVRSNATLAFAADRQFVRRTEGTSVEHRNSDERQWS